jgi:RimJ/RimL family protein N-acetyltransferase
MTEATWSAMAWAHVNGATQVEAFIDLANKNSIRLVERHAFVRTEEMQDGAVRFVRHFE